MTKRTIGISVVGFVIVLGFICLVIYLQFVDVTITLHNVRSASVTYNGISLAQSSSGDTIHVKTPRDSTIIVSYVGDESYESSSRVVTTTSKAMTISITPYYSTRTLQSRARQESSAIQAALSVYNPTIPTQYIVSNVKLYHYADWASAKLVWIGDETENSDTLRVVLKRDGSKWMVVNKPAILLYQDYYSSVPLDILHDVNNH